jgi:nitroreductase
MTDPIKNDTLDLIRQHGSVREYTAEPVPNTLLETLIEAGQHASTSSNLQLYSIIAVRDAETRQRLAGLCGNQAHVATAPIFLACCADLARMNEVCQSRGYTQVTDRVENFLLAAVDAVLVAQSVALAAESFGLGICYIGAIRNNPQAIIDLLRLPRLVFPVTGMTLGWPAKPPMLRPRLPTRSVLHYEQYSDDSSALHEDLMHYDDVMMRTGIYNNRQSAPPAAGTAPVDPHSYGWLEHSARRTSQILRPELKAVLSAQGFDLK